MFLTHLIQQLREQRVDLDGAADALHRAAGRAPPPKATGAKAVMQRLVDIITQEIRKHSPARPKEAPFASSMQKKKSSMGTLLDGLTT